MANSNKYPLWLRWWGLFIGAVSIFWLPIEDTTLTMLGLVSAGWGIWLAGWVFQRGWFRLNALRDWRLSVMAGALSGLMLPAAALLLVLIKAGLHGHGFLDFSFYQLGWLLVRTPLWVGMGGILGWLKGAVFGSQER